jgi:large subunit ribosomal protein L32
MGLPGHRRTSSHKRRRASHFALAKSVSSECPKCKSPVLPHRACKNCGFYRGRTVVDMTRAAARLVKRMTAKKPVKPQEHDHKHETKDEEKA